MATATGYEYTMKKYSSASWNDFKTCIVDLKIPMYTYISVNTGTDTFAHVVVAVGAEEFEHMYTTTEQYWLFGWHEKEVSHTDTYRYIRVIDGWDTSNSARSVSYTHLRRLRRMRDENGYENVEIECDGNVSFENAKKMSDAGANIFVAGTSSIYSKEASFEENIKKFREVIG